MTGFASGKYAYRISDRSGFRYRLKDMKKEELLDNTGLEQSPMVRKFVSF